MKELLREAAQRSAKDRREGRSIKDDRRMTNRSEMEKTLIIMDCTDYYGLRGLLRIARIVGGILGKVHWHRAQGAETAPKGR